MYFAKDIIRKGKNFISQNNHTPIRVFSKVGTILSRTARRTKVLGYPAHLMMEASSACQLACPLCPLGNRTLERQSSLMPLATFQKVIDDVGRYVYHININGMGEPLLNKNVPSMIEYAKKKNIYVDLYTNFQIQDNNLIERLVDAKLDSILIALDGATKEVYEKYRIKGKFENIINNIKLLAEIRKQKKSSFPEINIQFVAFEHNINQLEQMKKLVTELGADNLLVKRPFLFWEKSAHGDGEQYIAGQDEFSMYKKDNNKITWDTKPKKVCEALWGSSVVTADGVVAPCCFDYEGKMGFGNVNDCNFRDIWNNAKYQKFRKQIIKNWQSIPLCVEDFEGGCPIMYIQQDDWLINIKNQEH